MNIKYLSICLTLVATLFVSNVIAADSTAPASTDTAATATPDATTTATTDATAPATTATKKQKKANS